MITAIYKLWPIIFLSLFLFSCDSEKESKDLPSAVFMGLKDKHAVTFNIYDCFHIRQIVEIKNNDYYNGSLGLLVDEVYILPSTIKSNLSLNIRYSTLEEAQNVHFCWFVLDEKGECIEKIIPERYTITESPSFDITSEYNFWVTSEDSIKHIKKGYIIGFSIYNEYDDNFKENIKKVGGGDILGLYVRSEIYK